MSEHGWYANWDEESMAFQPVLQTKSGTVASLDIWFQEESACDGFIRDEVIGAGVFED